MHKMERHSRDAPEVCRGVNASWMLTVITITQSNMYEGSRLQEVGMSVHQSKHARVPKVNSQMCTTK